MWLIRSGRGWGKTRTGGEWVLERVRHGFRRIALVGQTKADVRDTMIELGDSSILNIAPPDIRPRYEPSKRRLVFPSGAVAIVYSGDEPDQLRGPQHDSAWVDELAKFKYPRQTWDNLKFGLRIGNNPQCVITTTPRPIPLLIEIIKRESTVDVRRSSYDNIANLSETYRREVLDPVAGTRIARQEIEGEILEDVPGALWRLEWIDALRCIDTPDLVRVVVAIDPAATSTEESAETGIIVVGKDMHGHGYVLDDCSLRGTPDSWARAAVDAYHKFSADAIVAETNNGGEMVELTLRTVPGAETIPYIAVHASRGKQTRAEPVSALYEQGRVSHAGSFPALEDQMCNWVPGDKSPDRMDALVWGMTELGLTVGVLEPGTMERIAAPTQSRFVRGVVTPDVSAWNAGGDGLKIGSRWRR